MNDAYRLPTPEATIRPRVKLITGSPETVETAVNHFLGILWSLPDHPVELESVTITPTSRHGSSGAPWIIATIVYYGPDLAEGN